MVVKITKNSILIKEVIDEIERLSKELKSDIRIFPYKDFFRLYWGGGSIQDFEIEEKKIICTEAFESSIFEKIKPILEKSKFTWEIDLY